MEKTEPVIFKGTAFGMYMIMAPELPVMEILEIAKMKIRQSSGFFKGKFNLVISGRVFTKSDKLRIASVMKTVLPDAEVYFDDNVSVNNSTH